MTQRICLVEDDPIMGESLHDRFTLEGYQVRWCGSLAEASAALRTDEFSVVISDIRLPDGDGETLFRKTAPSLEAPFMFITAYASVERAVRLLKEGAADYVVKPFDLDELVEKVRTLAPGRPTGGASMTLGISPAMKRVGARVAKIAAAGVDALVVGESGVGKEHVARLLHESAPGGPGRPFIAVNCGAFTETLLEAELFGHERGAFTGATHARRGVFERAQGGTLFLDEIGDMSPAMQVKLLRAIQEREIVRVGAEKPTSVEVTVLSATHRDLQEMVRDGEFREDLYYRINTVQVRIPPLRERPEDILFFADRFLEECPGHGASPRRLAPAARSALLAYAWPGNLRELRHTVERACILADREVIGPTDLFEEAGSDACAGSGSRGLGPADLTEHLRACERDHIVRALDENDGRIGVTAAQLGISRKALWDKMRRLEIPGKQSSGS